MSEPDEAPGAAPESLPPSKTQRKREAAALQALGVSLTECTPAELAGLPLDDTLRDALIAYQGMKAHGARKRQRQRIGRLMRAEDADTLQAALQQLRQPPPADPAAEAAADWTRRLIDEGAPALDDLIAHHPSTDRQRLRHWLRTIAQQPDSTNAQTTRQRLRRYLRGLLQAD